mgnify:FL=1|jgi:hypothetical protein
MDNQAINLWKGAVAIKYCVVHSAIAIKKQVEVVNSIRVYITNSVDEQVIILFKSRTKGDDLIGSLNAA